jgi:hypothetical protein
MASGYIAESRARFDNLENAYGGVLETSSSQFTAGGNGNADATILYMRETGNSRDVKAWIASGSTTGYDVASGVLQFASSDSTYYVLGNAMAAGSAKIYRDGSVLNSYTPTWAKQIKYLSLGYFVGTSGSAVQDTTYDWVRVRKWATTEPSVGSPTNEEKSVGPVAYWKFDEGYGTTAFNSTGTTGINATIYPASVSWATEDQCISGRCLFVNDVGSVYQSISSPDNTALGGMSALSVALWIKTTENKATQQIVYKRHDAGTPTWWSYKIQLDSLKPAFYVANSSGTNATATADTAIELNKWYYVVGIYDGSQVQIYVNGVASDSTPPSQTGTVFDSDTVFLIGGLDTPATYFFHGYVDDVKVYNYARTIAQIKSDYLSKGSGTVKGTSVQMGTNAQNSDALSNGLVGYWKMDESSWNGTANEVVDSSGNSVHGTAVNSASTTTAKYHRGGSFDGVSKYVNFTAISPTVSSFTAAAWIYITGDGNGGINSVMSADKFRFFINNSGNYMRSQIGSSGSYDQTSSVAVSRNTWHHIVLTFDGTTRRYYLDGVMSESNATYGTGAGWASHLGTIQSNAYYLNGTLDEARIYNRALSPVEVTKLYNWAPGPVGYWNFNEGSGNPNDSSGGGNNGTATNTTIIVGKFGKARLFSGNDYVSITNNSLLQPTGGLTILKWVRFNSFGDSWLVSNQPSTFDINYGYQLREDTPSNTIGFAVGHGGSATQLFSSGALNTDIWYFVSAVFDGSTAKIYINGVLNNSGSAGASTINYSGVAANMYIGQRSDNGFRTNAAIDEVKIYNYARTQKQIVEDMNAGHPSGGSPVGSQMAYWKFDEGYSTNAYDSGPNGYNGTFLSAPVWNNNCKFDKCLTFDNVDDGVSIANQNFTSLSDYTMSAWVRPLGNHKNYDGTIISSGDWNVNHWAFTLNQTNTAIALRRMDGTNSPSFSNTFPLDRWTYVAITRLGSVITAYVNGISIGTYTGTTGNLVSNATNTTIGRETYLGGYFDFNGSIDEVKIYSSALTADEIKQDYNRGSTMVLGSLSTSSDGITASNSAERAYCVPGDTSSCSGPVGEWKLDEKTSNTAYDTSGNANNGTISNGTWYSQGTCKQGTCVGFNGSSTNLAIGAAKYDTLTSATVELWFNYTGSFDTNRVFFSRYKDGTNRMPVFVSFSGGYGNKIAYENIVGGSNRAVTSDNTVSANTWYHIALTCGTGGMKMYLNGVQQTSTNATTDCFSAIAATTSTDFGSHNASAYFQGYIDQPKIYNYVRSPAQIAWDYNRGGPIGWWKMDECQGGTANDVSGNGNNGTITIGGSGTQSAIGTCTTSGTAWGNGTTGKYNSSLNLDGTDDYLGTGLVITSTQTLSNGISYSAWIKTTQSSNGAVVGMDTNTGCTYFCNSGVHININGNSGKAVMTQYSATDNYKYAVSTTTINDGSWHNIVGLRKTDGTLQIFVDGRLENSTAMSSYYTATTIRSNIGTDEGRDGQFFSGQIDDVKVFNYTLTPIQIKNLYNEASGIRYGP